MIIITRKTKTAPTIINIITQGSSPSFFPVSQFDCLINCIEKINEFCIVCGDVQGGRFKIVILNGSPLRHPCVLFNNNIFSSFKIFCGISTVIFELEILIHPSDTIDDELKINVELRDIFFLVNISVLINDKFPPKKNDSTKKICVLSQNDIFIQDCEVIITNISSNTI